MHFTYLINAINCYRSIPALHLIRLETPTHLPHHTQTNPYYKTLEKKNFRLQAVLSQSLLSHSGPKYPF